jgi:hypothetical protein
MERALARESVVATANAIFCGVILANLAIAADRMLFEYAPFSLSPTAAYAGAVLCGFALAAILEGAKWLFFAVSLAALVAMVILSAVLLSAAPEILQLGADFAFLYAFQQSFPRFIVFCVMGGVGALAGNETKRFLARR